MTILLKSTFFVIVIGLALPTWAANNSPGVRCVDDYIYTPAGTKINFEFKSPASCSNFISFLNRDQKLSAVVADMEKVNFMALNYLSPFVSGVSDRKVGFTNQKKCEVAADAYHLTKSKNGYLVEGCRPDTLYSWGDFGKLNWFISNLKNNQTWMNELPRSLFTTPSAAATFGYGPVPIRFKIKSSVRFKTVPKKVSDCDSAIFAGAGKKKDFQNTIYQRFAKFSDGVSFVDYIICSPKVIESFSYAMPEHFDEIIKDYRWMATENDENWEAYSKTNGHDQFIDNTLDNASYDNRTDYSILNLSREMALLRLMITNKVGQVVAEKGGSTEAHFKTRWPIYFNPQ